MVLARAIRRVLVACAFLAFGIPAVQAQGLKDGPAPAPVFTWGGAYFGLHAGWGWADVSWRNDYPHTDERWRIPTGFDADSPVYGGQLGIQTQRGNWVLGLETSLSGFTDRERRDGVPLFEDRRIGDVTARIDWLFMAVGRVGYAWGNTMAYFKGGYAGAEIRLETNDNNTPTAFTSVSNRWHNGWTIGTGFEYLWFPNVTVGVEYNFVSLGSSSSDTRISNGDRFRSHADVDLHTVLARMNFKFDFMGGNP